MIEIPLSQGLVAIIDDADLQLVEGRRWCATVDRKAKSPRMYAVTNIVKADGQRSMLRMHRLITGALSGQLVDHRNHDGLDNRRGNLRVATLSQNGGNARSASGYKGVGWHKQRGKWRAYIEVNRQARHLGLFDDPWEAAQAYNAAAREAWGEFAHLNDRIVTELLGGAAVRDLRKKTAA